MKINGIWSKVGGQKMKFSIVLAKKWVGKYPPCPPGFDASDYCWSIWHHFYISACMMCLLIKWTFLAIRWRAKSFIDFLKSRFKLITVPNLIQGGHSKVGQGSKLTTNKIHSFSPNIMKLGQYYHFVSRWYWPSFIIFGEKLWTFY